MDDNVSRIVSPTHEPELLARAELLAVDAPLFKSGELDRATMS